MIAVLVVNGGPGPHFLSEDLVNYLAGEKSIKLQCGRTEFYMVPVVF